MMTALGIQGAISMSMHHVRRGFAILVFWASDDLLMEAKKVIILAG
jgi:hypothetical protein